MSLVNMKEMLCEARKAKKAIGAFNITNYETAAAVLKAAEAENEPVIISSTCVFSIPERRTIFAACCKGSRIAAKCRWRSTSTMAAP